MVSFGEYNDGRIIVRTGIISLSEIFTGPEIISNHKLVFFECLSRHFIKMEWKNRWCLINNSIENDKNIFINGETGTMHRLMFVGTSHMSKFNQSQFKYRIINIEHYNSMLLIEKIVIKSTNNDLNSFYSIWE